MSENNTETTKQTTIFVPGTQVKEFTFPSGDKVLRLSINLEKFAPFVKQFKNENGYINFNIKQRREIGAYGDTHNVSLDQWKPKAKTETPPTKEKSTKPVEKKELKKTAPAPAPEPEEEFV